MSAAPALAAPRPRLKQRYVDELRGQLQGELGLGNIMQVPRLDKIVVNMGVGRATQQASLLEGAVRDLSTIAGQKPVVTRAKKSIAGFKLRKGNAIGCKVTLRGDRMWEFLDRLISLAIPRIRDFRGLDPNSFDRDRLRQDRHDTWDGHHHRHHRRHRCRGQGPAGRLRLPVPLGHGGPRRRAPSAPAAPGAEVEVTQARAQEEM